MPKYPCTDGVDRDSAIEEYLATQKRLAEVVYQSHALRQEERLLEHRLSELFHDHLGPCGMAAAIQAGQQQD